MATLGQLVIAGTDNSETFSTGFCRLSSGSCGFTSSALFAQTDLAGGTGDFGKNSGTTGVGVWGQTGGVGSAVYGEATSSKTVALAGVTTSSMVLATAQQAKAAHVKAAVPGTGLFTIRLTAKAPVGGLKVAYFVLN